MIRECRERIITNLPESSVLVITERGVSIRAATSKTHVGYANCRRLVSSRFSFSFLLHLSLFHLSIYEYQLINIRTFIILYLKSVTNVLKK